MQHLTLSGYFNQSIEGVAWPSTLRDLVFGFCFNHPIEGVTWPPSLKLLSFPMDFNQPIGGVSWPHSIEELTLGTSFKPAGRRREVARVAEEVEAGPVVPHVPGLVYDRRGRWRGRWRNRRKCVLWRGSKCEAFLGTASCLPRGDSEIRKRAWHPFSRRAKLREDSQMCMIVASLAEGLG